MIKKAKSFDGYLNNFKLSKTHVENLKFSGDIVEEVWNSLEYFSEIEEVGLKELESRGIPKNKITLVYKILKARIKQAKNFYLFAANLPSKSAALLYYYAFHNLISALLVINHHEITNQKSNHGLVYSIKKNGDDFGSEKIKIKESKDRYNLFPLLYEYYFSQKVALSSLNIRKLLGYCTDIGYQYTRLFQKTYKIYPALMAIVLKRGDKKCWPIIAIDRSAKVSEYKKSFSKFFENFEEVTIDESPARELFNLDVNIMVGYQCFQSRFEKDAISDRIIPDFAIKNEVINMLDGLFQPNCFNDEVSFFINLPYSSKNQQPFNESLAIFSIMFYLSSLVRYRPEYLEQIYSEKEMWLINAFIQSCPLTFLRTISAEILQKTYILSVR